MSSRVVWEGLEQLREDLRNLPGELVTEAQAIVSAAASGAATDAVRGYQAHRHTGYLAGHVRVTAAPSSAFGAGAIVTNTAPHASIFDIGTQARHTALGANRGAMPPGKVFGPAMQKRRRQMYEDLKALVGRKGLTVTGNA